jgi:sterol desaturase/sphingolipid hydroxylase (fatty acid hydroxylase superfamily)
MLEERINQILGDNDPTGFGTGWWSGVLSAFLGLLAFGAVICLHFPQLLSSPDLRPYYPMHVMRLAIQGVIVGAIVLGVVSAMLRRKKVLALTGMLFALGATLLGGASVPINEELSNNAPAIGLDWFLLDMLLMTLIFSPIEVLWPAYPRQSVFRSQWLTDIVYFLSTHLPIQITTFLIMLPAIELTSFLNLPIAKVVGQWPWVVQFFLAVLVADLAEYFIHRAFHKVPFMWRFHAIHHSSKALDWIAGSRSHIVDDICVRGFILIPMMLVFPHSMMLAYLFFVNLHATWTHCNFGPTIKWLEPFLIQPRYHHWHHTSQKEAIDKNFAIHFPWIDRIFGTYYFPDEWPQVYGLAGEAISTRFFWQTIDPFIKKRRPISKP